MRTLARCRAEPEERMKPRFNAGRLQGYLWSGRKTLTRQIRRQNRLADWPRSAVRYAMARSCGCGNAKMEDVAFYNGHKAPYARCHAHEIRAHMRPPQIFTTAHVYPFSTTFRAHTQTDGNGPPLVRVAPRALRSRVALCFVPRPRGSVIVLSHVTNYIASSRPPGILRGDAPLRYPPTQLS